MSNLYFYRDNNGFEVDLLLQQGRELIGIEIKSSATYFAKQLKNLDKLAQSSQKIGFSWLVYDGQAITLSHNKKTICFNPIKAIFQ